MLVHQQPAIPPAPAVVNPASAPRKRRRRAPTTGAAEDCFTCRASGTKCDRRRPYCGPCLDIGDECKGYRTQLTWGVGVASRGKLRGMTLPVSIESNISVAERDRRCAVKKKSTDETTEKAKRLRNSLEATSRLVGADRRSISGDIAKLSIITNYDFVNMEHPLASNVVNSTMPKIDHGSAKPRTPMETSYTTSIANTPLIIQPPYSPATQHTQQRQEYTSDMLNFHKPPYSPNSVTSHTPSGLVVAPEFPEYDRMYTSHNEGSYSLSSSPSISPLYDGSLIASSAYLPATTITVSSSMPSYAPLATSTHPGQQFLDAHHIHAQRNQQWGHITAGSLHKQQTTVGGNLSDLLYGDEMLAHPDSEFTFTISPYSTSVSKIPTSQPGQYFNNYHATVPHISTIAQIPLELQPPQLANLSTELKFLVDYYDKTVCPSIVAFDGPSNPYRTHILRLAFQNDALMEAVCALSCSHLQQKKKTPLLESRRSSPPRFSSRSSSQSPRNSTSPPPRTSATSYHNSSDIISVSKLHNLDSSALSHKNSSIKLLNNQLTDSSLAVTDSAMATLLILCLYHICETGIGQFKTHLAGVKKLMGMRGAGKETGRWGWMETVFTWFDNMSASVNNREAQLRGGYLDMVAETNDDWDLESLTGCNRHLFMRLAGLGRINMLSQQAPTNFYKPGPYRQMEDDDSEPVRNENDGRDEFWASWNAMKNDLLAWKPCAKYAATPSRHRAPEFDYSSVDFDFTPQIHSPTSSNSTLHSISPSSPPRKASKAYEAVERNHWIHSSNVWRYAAILYLDRLAYPHLSSSHHVFQNTVRIVLDHLNCIPTTSGLSKSLMWPLFITGTECVVDDHRMLIRERCFDMQRDCGFFNKVSGLDVLETLWDIEIDDDGYYGPSRYVEPGSETIGGRGLRWRRVTQQEDGEYLMI